MGFSDRASFLQTQAAVPLGLRLTGLSGAKVGTGLGCALCSEVSVGVVNGRVAQEVWRLEPALSLDVGLTRQ